jgi:RND family efflux transporter MFP subunit
MISPKSLLRLAVLALVLLGAWLIWRSAAKPDDIPVVRLEQRPAERVLAVVGRVRPKAIVEIKAQSAGRIIALPRDEGDIVNRGDLLARIEADEEVAAVAVNEAQLGALRADLTLAQRTFERTAKLAATGYASPAALDNARAGLNAAKARLKAAQATISEAKARTRNFDVRAPMAGLLLVRPIDPGQVIDTQTTLFELGSLGAIEIEAEVDEFYADAVALGMAAVISPSGSQTRLDAEVSEVSPRVDPATGGRLVRLAPKTLDSSLRPGRSIDVTIRIEALLSALAIPRGALRKTAKGLEALALEAGTVVAKPVEIIDWPGSQVIITKGLKAGDLIVTDPVAFPPGSRGVAQAPAGAQ